MSEESANREATSSENKIDAATARYAEGFENFSSSKYGNLILDFAMFKRNILPYTLQVLYALTVIVAWLVSLAGLIGKGPIGDMITTYGTTSDRKPMTDVAYFKSFLVSVLVIVLAPFVLHYVFELVKIIWRFLVHVYEKVLVPIWQTIVIRFFANVFPQILPFVYERFMKVIDIVIDRIGPMCDAVIDGVIAVAMTIAAVLKGVVWLPKSVCQRLARWFNKPEANAAK